MNPSKQTPRPSKTNLIWLEQAGQRFGAPPEAILNVILDRIRQKDEGQKNLPAWVDAAGKDATVNAELLMELRKTSGEVGSTVKGCELYLRLIEKFRIT